MVGSCVKTVHFDEIMSLSFLGEKSSLINNNNVLNSLFRLLVSPPLSLCQVGRAGEDLPAGHGLPDGRHQADRQRGGAGRAGGPAGAAVRPGGGGGGQAGGLGVGGGGARQGEAQARHAGGEQTGRGAGLGRTQAGAVLLGEAKFRDIKVMVFVYR